LRLLDHHPDVVRRETWQVLCAPCPGHESGDGQVEGLVCPGKYYGQVRRRRRDPSVSAQPRASVALESR